MKESTTKHDADTLNFHNPAALEASRALHTKLQNTGLKSH